MAEGRRRDPSEPFIEDAHRFPEERQKKRRPPAAEQEARRRRTQQRRKRNSVFRYIAFLFAAAFVLLLMTFLMERRQSQQQIDDLKQSNSAAQTLQGLIDENSQLKTEAGQLKEQLKDLQDQLNAAKEEQGLLQAQIQGEQRSDVAMQYFWQINEASVRGKTKLCRELITKLEEGNFQNDLPKENITGTDRFSPYDRYMDSARSSSAPCSKRTKDLGLGRGLNALLGDPELPAQGEGSVTLPISQVEPGLNQPRKRFEQGALDDLAESIRVHGIIQPLTVRRLASGYYQIIAGERRWRAAKAAGLAEVPAVIIEADDRKVMELGLIENLQREDLNPAEEARGYRTLMEEYGLTQEQVAQRMGKSRPAIANTLRLLALPDEVLALMEEGSLSAGHARAILGAPTAALQKEAAARVVKEQLSVRQTEALIKALQKEKNDKPKEQGPDLSLYLGELEKDLAGRLGRKVKIAHRGKRGKIELEYYSEQDLETLLALLQSLRSRGGGQDG